MRNFLPFAAVLALFVSCAKKETTPMPDKKDSTFIIDSINAARTRINNSIRSQNRFKDFSGDHTFTHDLIKAKGSITFKKISGERDRYEVYGAVKSGKDNINIQGTVNAVSDKHLNFSGIISQSISENDNGKPYTRKGTKTFMSKDGGKTYRLQDMVNGSGFVDYIDIQF